VQENLAFLFFFVFVKNKKSVLFQKAKTAFWVRFSIVVFRSWGRSVRWVAFGCRIVGIRVLVAVELGMLPAVVVDRSMAAVVEAPRIVWFGLRV